MASSPRRADARRPRARRRRAARLVLAPSRLARAPLAHHRVRVDDPSSPPRPRRLLASPRRVARRTRYARAPSRRTASRPRATATDLPASARVPAALGAPRSPPDRPGDAVVVGRESPPSDVVFRSHRQRPRRGLKRRGTGELFVTDLQAPMARPSTGDRARRTCATPWGSGTRSSSATSTSPSSSSSWRPQTRRFAERWRRQGEAVDERREESDRGRR